MPANKTARQSARRSQRNRSTRTSTRTGVAKALRSMESGEPREAEAAVTQAISLLDRAVRKGLVHRNAAARRKSRLAARLNRLKAASPG